MLRSFLLLPLAFFSSVLWAADPSVPVAPDVLIKHLPKPLTGWKVTESRARSDFASWLLTSAIRSYEIETAEGDTRTLQINLIDTGGYEPSTAAFKNFTPQKGDGFEMAKIAGHPAIIIRTGESAPVVQMLAHGRYQVDFALSQGGLEDLKPWITAIPFAKLGKLPVNQVAIEKLPKEVTLAIIDEMDPSQNRTYLASVTTHAEQRAADAADAAAGIVYEACE